MNPNPEVYGTSETWSDCAIFYTVGSGDISTKTIKPQIQVWDSESLAERKGTLSRAITAGKLTAGVPIDPTICPCGQDPLVSCFGKIGLFKNHSDTDANKIPDKIVTYDNPVNWFFSEIWIYYPGGRAFRPQLADRDSDLCRWSPNGNLTDLYNQNRYVTPFVYYQLKSIFANIYVNTITGYDNAGRPNHGQMTLEEWKNNYPTRKIDSAVLRLKGVTSQTGGTIAYTGGNLDDYRSVGVSLLNDIDGIIDYYTYYEDRRQYVRLFGDLSANAFNTTDTYYMLAYDMFENVEVKSVFESGQTQGGWCVWQEIPYSETNYEKILKMAACFGIPFSPTSKEIFAAEFTDTDLYLPVIDDDGIAHGEYTHGLRNVANPLYDKDSIRDIDYDPSQNVDPNTYSNTTGFNSISGGASATIKYVLDSSNVRQLLTDLWTISHDIAGLDYENYDYKILDSFLVSNPIDSIVSIKRFPFEIPHTFTTQKTNVCLGKNTGNARGYVTYDVFNSVLFSGVKIFPKFGNSFLDYAPYTEYELYIPFCGTVKLNAGDILGHTLNCRLQIDLTTGACVAYIMADDLVIETATGVVSCELQVAGTDSATVDSAIQNAVINHIGAREGMKAAAYSAVTPAGLFSTIANPVKYAAGAFTSEAELTRAEYNLTHIQTPVHSMGNAGGLTGWYQEFNARLIIYYPEGEAIDSSAPVSSTSPHLADLTAYAHNVGFACVLNGTASEFHGKTVGNIDTSSIVGATEEERAQIKALFAQGVWLP